MISFQAKQNQTVKAGLLCCCTPFALIFLAFQVQRVFKSTFRFDLQLKAQLCLGNRCRVHRWHCQVHPFGLMLRYGYVVSHRKYMQFYLVVKCCICGVAKLQDICCQAELVLLLMRCLGFCCAPILCNCARGLVPAVCTEEADEARKMALRKVLGGRPVRAPSHWQAHIGARDSGRAAKR